MSWDRYNADAGRIVRLTLAVDGQPIDGRLWGNVLDDPVRQLPQVERIAKLHEVYRPELKYSGKSIVADEKTCLVNKDFLDIFDIEMLEGELPLSLSALDQVIISESMAKRMTAISRGKLLEDLQVEGEKCRITGVFKDIPETSHWRADVLRLMPEDAWLFCYTYLLLKDGSDIRSVEAEISDIAASMSPDGASENGGGFHALLMPLTDIHLHSHNLRELEANGNVVYIWLILGANALLLVVVMFNLWLNVSLVFFTQQRALPAVEAARGSDGRGIQNGGVAGSRTGFGCDCYRSGAGRYGIPLRPCRWRNGFYPYGHCLHVFHGGDGGGGGHSGIRRPGVKSFSYKNVRWMLCGQYIVVIAALAITIGIYKQMNTVERLQTGGDGRDIVVMSGLTEPYMEKYPLFRERLLQSPYVKGMTTCFQIPGDAIRDHVDVRCAGSVDWMPLPIMIAGDGFLKFYDIPLLAGKDFSALDYDIRQEDEMMMDFLVSQKASQRSEEYIINRSAMQSLGFGSPQEAVGRSLEIRHGSIGYIANGTIAGVTDDYNYAGVFEENTPLVMLHRNFFQFVLMVRLDNAYRAEALQALSAAWDDVYPDSQSDFTALSGIFHDKYRNEYGARDLVLVFTLLCLLVADLGLIVFMAFIIRRHTKEIAIRKVNGATARDIAGMLNSNFVLYIVAAFIAAVPVSWLVLHTWQQRFAYKTSLDWWIFLLAGISVLFISLVSVSLQSWKAACVNPAQGVRK